MLTRNYMTAKELGWSKLMHTAAIHLLGMLERGEIRYEPLAGMRYFRNICVFDPETINMAQWRCGTAACLGGWIEYLGNVPMGYLDAEVKRPGEDTRFDRLFYPDNDVCDNRELDGITLEQMTAALRNFLTTGEADWEIVLRK